MNPMRSPAAVLIALTAATGCSSNVEVEYDREELCTAVRAESGPAPASEWSRTRVRLDAERTVLAPPPPPVVAVTPPPETAPEPQPTETRDEPVVPPAITTVHIETIDIHLGDVVQIVQVQSDTHVENAPAPTEAESVSRPRMTTLPSRPASVPSSPPLDPRVERLERQYKAQVRQWEKLFERRPPRFPRRSPSRRTAGR